MRSTKQTTTTEKTSTEKPESAQQAPRSNSVNQVTLIGRLVADPQLRETGNGRHVTTVRVATNSGAAADFHNVVLWGQYADFATTYLKKGRLVEVVGRLQTRSWTAADGSTRNTVEVVASRFQTVPSNSDEPAA
jgi:single-strand DNA-binding protein